MKHPFAEEQSTYNKTRMIRYGIAIVIAFVIASIILTSTVIHKQFLLQKMNLEKEQSIQISHRKENFSIWLTSLLEQGGKLISSDLFKLFSAEVARLDDRVGVLFSLGALESVLPSNQKLGKDDKSLVAQLPLMQNLLREFIVYSDFLSGKVVNKSSHIYLSSVKNTPPLAQNQKELVREVFETGRALFSPLKSTSNGLILDIYFPIESPYMEPGAEKKVVAVLIASKIVSAEISKFLGLSSNISPNKSYLYLVQNNNTEYVAENGTIEKIQKNTFLSKEDTLPFALRASVTNPNNSVYSSGSLIANTQWLVVEETTVEVMYSSIKGNVLNVVIFAGLATCIVILVFIALWWYLMHREQRSLAEDFKSLYHVIEEQQELLNGINSSIVDMIALTDVNDTIQYVNKAFAEKVDKLPEVLLGLTMQEVFGFDTAKRIVKHDPTIIATGKAYSFEEIIFIKSQKHIFQIIRTPYLLEETNNGIVSVFRDITTIKDNIEYSKKLLEQTVDALVHTVEMRDPYLAGHTQMMRTCVEGICKELECDEQAKQTMLIATDLSQIGKIFIPVELLTKTTPLTDEEKALVEEHVQYALRVISGIEFKLPVAKIVEQMNERIDGSGYPSHLKNTEICFEAKIVAVANVFSALVKPRSYRNALTVKEAIKALEEQGGYEAEVVHALNLFLSSEQGKIFINTQIKPHRLKHR